MATSKLPNPLDYFIYTGEPLRFPGLYAYVLAGQGIIKCADSRHFSAAMPLTNGCRVAGLPDYPLGIFFNLPRIPGKWLTAVLGHARKQSSQNQSGVLHPAEQMYHFHWQVTGGAGKWAVAVPKQDASPGRVNYRGGDEASVILDLHSHHEMEAYFSRTDDDDEQGFRFYAVIGKIYTRPEIRIRLGIYGDWQEVNPEIMFDGLGPFTQAGNSIDRAMINEYLKAGQTNEA